ncbi:MAG: hypothetical protein IJ792_04440 [Oscillospiraceae bacterium]|nr:hypothetical protein [Oscillospiraceae bacterium]
MNHLSKENSPFLPVPVTFAHNPIRPTAALSPSFTAYSKSVCNFFTNSVVFSAIITPSEAHIIQTSFSFILLFSLKKEAPVSLAPELPFPFYSSLQQIQQRSADDAAASAMRTINDYLLVFRGVISQNMPFSDCWAIC